VSGSRDVALVRAGAILDLVVEVFGGGSSESLEAAAYIDTMTAERTAPDRKRFFVAAGRLADLERKAYLKRNGNRPADESPALGAPVVLEANTVTTRPPEPLWPGRLYFGKAALIEGVPGVSKTTLALDVIARASRGGPMPGSDGSFPPVNSLILSAEDDLSDTLVPRLRLAGADLSRVRFLVGKVAPDGDTDDDIAIPTDTATFRDAVTTTGARLVLIDPLFAYIATATDANVDHKVRRALGPLHRLAAETGTCVMAIRHHRKAAGADPLLAGGGSIGITAAARLALLVARDPDDEGAVLLAAVKSNIGPPTPTLRYRLATGELPEHPSTTWTRIVWEGTSGRSAAEIMAAQMEDRESAGAREQAEEWLRDTLSGGPMPSKAIVREAREAGIAPRTLDRAKASLGVEAARHGGIGAAGSWCWFLPAEPKYAKEPLSTPISDVAHLGDSGVLREPLVAPVGSGLERVPALVAEPDFSATA
jgi:putative DNA primase/helicase